jgi:hypothetical protein
MRSSNIDITHGLVMSEAVMMGPGRYIGREHAHDLVYDLCQAIATERPLPTFSPRTPDQRPPRSRGAARLCDPALSRRGGNHGRPAGRRDDALAKDERRSSPQRLHRLGFTTLIGRPEAQGRSIEDVGELRLHRRASRIRCARADDVVQVNNGRACPAAALEDVHGSPSGTTRAQRINEGAGLDQRRPAGVHQ